MEFLPNKSIFLQIADNICNQILEGKLKPEERIASVRDLATKLEVNRNTVMRAYSNLQEEQILKNKRGIGFFVSKNALKLIKENDKKDIFKIEIPYLISKIKLLKLNSTDLKELLIQIENNDCYESK